MREDGQTGKIIALIEALGGGGGGGGAAIVHELPASPVDGTLYILDTDWTMHVHDADGWHTVGGSVELDTSLFEFEYSDGATSLEKTIKGE